MKQIIIIFTCLLSYSGIAQTGKVSLFVLPSTEYQVLVDEKDLYKNNTIFLSEGVHNIKIYAPGCYLFDTTITIAANKEVEIIKELSYTSDFLKFIEEDQQYENRLTLYKIPSAFITAGGILYSTIQFVEMQHNYDEIQALNNSYHTASSTDEIQGIKSKLILEKEEFASNKKAFNISIGATLLSAGVTALLWRKANRMEVPQHLDKVKLQFNSYVSDVDNKIVNRIGLTYAF
jgi:hypothetical protein